MTEANDDMSHERCVTSEADHFPWSTAFQSSRSDRLCRPTSEKVMFDRPGSQCRPQDHSVQHLSNNTRGEMSQDMDSMIEQQLIDDTAFATQASTRLGSKGIPVLETENQSIPVTPCHWSKKAGYLPQLAEAALRLT